MRPAPTSGRAARPPAPPRRGRAWATAALAVAAALAASACADGDDDAATGPGAANGGTAGGETAAERCAHPEGFSVRVPGGWHANDGTETAPCSYFGPEPFDVRAAASDARPAPVGARVEDVPLARIAAPQPGRDARRSVTAIDGLQAVRLAYETSGEGLYPAGTPVTLYAVDLAPREAGTPSRTLVLDAVGVGDADHDAATRTLDRMARSVRVSLGADRRDPDVVARFGGAEDLRVTARIEDGEVCLRVAPSGTPACAEAPAADEATLLRLDTGTRRILAGVTGHDVAEVRAPGGGGDLGALTVPVEEADARAFALPREPGRVEQVRLLDDAGRTIGRADVRGGDPEGLSAPVGEPREPPIATDDFPAAGRQALLVDVRVGAHEGFDRVVFEFRGDRVPGYRIAYVDRPVREDGSGRPVPLEGDAALEIRMAPAAGFDATGDGEPTYTGPQRLAPSAAGALRELVRIGDFEGQLAWAAGLGGRHPVAVATLGDPARLVVDIAHDG